MITFRLSHFRGITASAKRLLYSSFCLVYNIHMGTDSDLESRQEEMRERWADKRRHPKSWKLVSSDAGELIDINKVLNKGVRCRVCRKNAARVSKRTGEIMPCNSCRNKKYLTKLAA